MNNVLLIAAPGAGKGVCSSYLKEKYDLVHISTGNLLRDECKKNESLKQMLNEGKLVDSETVFKLFDKFLQSNLNCSYVFEGIPRSLEQIEPFESILQKNNINIDKVIFITIDKDIALKRVTGRVMCEDCNEIYNKYFDSVENMKCKKCKGNLKTRDDDDASVYEDRYELFLQSTMPVIEYFKNKYNVYEVSNNGSIEEIYKQIDEVMNVGVNNDNN